jgi:hypothetical protein
MKTLIQSLLLIFFITPLRSQQVFEEYKKLNGNLRYGTGKSDVMPYGDCGYTLALPNKSIATRGSIIMLDDQKINLKDTSDTQHIHIEREANTKGYAVLYVSTGIPVDLYFSATSLIYVDTLLKRIFHQYHLPDRNIFLLGSMVSGHRALKYIEYCRKGKSVFNPDLTGVVICESAIDWVRQWYECQKQVRDNATPVKYFEGNFITWLFKENIKTTPITDINAYIDFSTYSYFDTKMTKRELYKDLAIRAYTFADTRYWFSAQGYGVYDSNYPDMSGFINEQKLAGNKKAELIVFHSNPDDPIKNELRRQSATWDLVDKTELIDWMTALSK